MTGILAAVVLELMRESLSGTHCRYREYVDGVPREEYVTRYVPGPSPSVASGESRCSIATVTGPSPGLAVLGHPLPAGEGRWNVGGRVVRRVVRGATAYDYDISTGALVRAVPLWFNAKPARVFDPNPVVATNDPSLRDRNDAANAVPASAYSFVQLEGVQEGPLRGPHVTIVDRQTPNVAPADASGDLVVDREHDAFEDVSAYFHIDRNQRYLQSLGFTGSKQIVPYSIETDAHGAGGVDNSFFLPSFTEAGKGTLYFGTGGTDDAEDADLVVHEYGHAIQEWIAPGTFGGTFSSQSRALSEGFGDYWAWSAHHAQRLASGRDPFCFADWDARCAGDDPSEQCGYPADADCLRRLDLRRTMADYDRGDVSGVEHRNGAIWSGALIDLFDRAGKRVTDTLVVEALFGTPPNPTFSTMAARLVSADRQLFGGTHATAICDAMSARGIVAPGDCAYTPRGELTWVSAPDRALPIPENNTIGVSTSITVDDARAIERVAVRVDITHTARGDLRVTLIAPDGTKIILQQVSLDRTGDVHATFGVDTVPFESLDVLRGRSAAGTWTLNVADMRALDAGTLDSWALAIQFAGDVPRNERPSVSASARVIPVVGHITGTTLYRTDVHLLNRSAEPRTAMLIYTPSGANGRTTFSAARVAVGPNQVVAIHDVLPSLFNTTGIGSLVVDGDVLAQARIDSPARSELVDAVRGSRGPLALENLPPLFTNAGIVETAGRAGVVEVAGRTVALQPFSHVQFGVLELPFSSLTARVVSGDPEIVLYAAGTAYLEASDPGPRVAPAINGGPWITTITSGGATRYFGGTINVMRSDVPMRVAINGVPVPPSGTGALFPVEVSAAFRTNLTLIADQRTVAHVTVRDAGGGLLDAFDRILERDVLAQIPLAARVVDGWITVEGEGVHAWASVIHNATGAFTILHTD